MEVEQKRVAGNDSPRFSVIIPAFNAASTIARAIDSVLGQSYPPHEVIVVDDGSNDATQLLVSRYGTQVLYLRQENAGPSAARNHGVALATGDWIAFLDADDWYYTDRLLIHAEMIQATPGLDFLVANFDYRNAQGGLLYQSMSKSDLGRRLLAKQSPMDQVILDEHAIAQFIAAQFSDTRTVSLPRRTFLELGGFSIDLRICEDLVFLIRLCARSSKAGATCRPLAAYVVHEHGLIRSDRLRAQTETIRALRSLHLEMAQYSAPLRRAWRRLIKEAHLNLAFYQSKKGQKTRAVANIARSMRFLPEVADLKNLVSVLLG